MNEILQKMISAGDNGLLNPGAIAQYQVEATLELAEQVKRIADLLEQTSIENDDGTRTLYLMAGVERIG